MLDYDYLDHDEAYRVLVESLDQRGDTSINRAELAVCRDKRRSAMRLNRQLQALRETKNSMSRRFGELKRNQQPLDGLRDEIAKLDEHIFLLDRQIMHLEADYYEFWLTVPNIPQVVVPDGLTEANNIELNRVHRLGKELTLIPPCPIFDFKPRDHVELGIRMGCMDFEQTAKISGGRFVTLKGALAKLERVLGYYMIESALAGTPAIKEVSPPTLVRREAMEGTGQLPKFADDLFATGSHYLIPTAEVSLTNMARDRLYRDFDVHSPIFEAFVAQTPCYRKEAGSAGRDTRGMMRLHQFEKVEIVMIAHPNSSNSLLGWMRRHSEDILATLGLHFRSVELCKGELGFSAARTYDLEVWIPSQNTFREIASLSNCGDFQARRMNARFSPDGHPAMKSKGTQFVHTLNGSALAIGRTLIAIMENHQTEDGSISLPEVLRPLMGGSIIAPDGSII